MLWRRKELRRRRTSKSHLLLFSPESMVRARRFRQLTSQRRPTSGSLSAPVRPASNRTPSVRGASKTLRSETPMARWSC